MQEKLVNVAKSADLCHCENHLTKQANAGIIWNHTAAVGRGVPPIPHKICRIISVNVAFRQVPGKYIRQIYVMEKPVLQETGL